MSRASRAAVALSLLAHAVAIAFFLSRLPDPPVAAPSAIEVALVDPTTPATARRATPTPAATPSTSRSTDVRVAPAATSTVAVPSPGSSVVTAGPSVSPTPGARGGAVDRSIEGMIAQHYRAEREAAGADPTIGGPKDPRLLRPGATATDSLDGIANLGSGEPGDPRIPGAGPVDIGKVMERDAVVAIAKIRSAEGVVHPFICDVKERMERDWNPTPSDLSVIPGEPMRVEDPVCAQGYHLRFKVAKVLAVYDSAGMRIRLDIVGAPWDRRLKQRVEHALDSAGMKAPPADLLDKEGHLRLAWNVFADSYAGCNLVGEDSRGRKAYGVNSFVIGIVELDGQY